MFKKKTKKKKKRRNQRQKCRRLGFQVNSKRRDLNAARYFHQGREPLTLRGAFPGSQASLEKIPGPCRRPVGHGDLGRRGPPEPGRGEFSLLRLWQQPADGADPPPKPLGRVLQRGPPAVRKLSSGKVERNLLRPNSQDFKLDFGNPQGKTSETWHGGIATIFESPGDEVWGVVWKMNKSNLSSLDKQEGVKSGMYVPIEVNVSTQEGKEITCRSYQMTNYERVPPSPQYKKVICLGAKENGLPPDYQKKLNAIEPNDYKGKVSEEIEDIIKKGEAKTH
ncbi:gamma-glutamylcyclotransferase isoform X1 [Monodon monoceros]|uniref:gamma-glutamylcyclotransferase isoform X1 n=1 Tax=Monodon monoceros TaxID=40151 RepID=UPI0010F4CD68|nr:gamma-glutamylcyclotransferase isoform X1 [Monodon monoceros]